jgi:uncharacterized membrane protein
MDAERGGRAIIAVFVGIAIVSITLNAVTEMNPILLITGTLVLFALLAVWAYWKPKARKKASTPPE